MSRKTNYGILILILAAIYFTLEGVEKNINPLSEGDSSSQDHNIQQNASAENGVGIIERAYKNKQGNIQVQSIGKVIAVLPDDNEGSRHQKFILELENGQTILVAHNIDLAPRIPHLKKGDIVEFYGEYEYSNKGGVIHWTHHDPQKRHVDGWLIHQGKAYK